MTRTQGDSVILETSLKNSFGKTYESGGFLIWNSDSLVLGSGNPIIVELSGSIFLTNLEHLGVYSGNITIDVYYN